MLQHMLLAPSTFRGGSSPVPDGITPPPGCATSLLHRPPHVWHSGPGRHQGHQDHNPLLETAGPAELEKAGSAIVTTHRPHNRSVVHPRYAFFTLGAESYGGS
jgi:hypothetical protein